MQPIVEHPDELAQQHAVKQITRGSRQAAEDKAMDAYWLALEAGCDNEQAAEVFSKTYQQFVSKHKHDHDSWQFQNAC